MKELLLYLGLEGATEVIEVGGCRLRLKWKMIVCRGRCGDLGGFKYLK